MIGNKFTEKDLRDWLSLHGYYGNSAKIEELEAAPTGADGQPTSSNSYAFPATNKALTEKVRAYQLFLADYIIKAQAEKAKAVATAEAKMKDKYEAIISDMEKK